MSRSFVCGASINIMTIQFAPVVFLMCKICVVNLKLTIQDYFNPINHTNPMHYTDHLQRQKKEVYGLKKYLTPLYFTASHFHDYYTFFVNKKGCTAVQNIVLGHKLLLHAAGELYATFLPCFCQNHCKLSTSSPE